MRKINIGVVGCGYWGPNLVRNFHQSQGAVVSGICDKNTKSLKRAQALYKVPGFRNIRDLLSIKGLDAVAISTPAQSHYSLVKESLLHHKHVLVEKPLSLSVPEALELAKLSKSTGRILMVGHTFLYNPAVRLIKNKLKTLELGKVYYIHAKRTNLGPLRKDVNALWDLAPHDISIINYLLGSTPREVSAYAQRFLDHKLEDVGFIILRYPRNILVHIHVSWLDPKKIREITVIGDKKMLVYDDTNIAEPIRVYDKKVMKRRYTKSYRTFKEFQMIIREGETSILKVDMQEPLRLECRDFIRCVTQGRRPLSGPETAINVIKVLEAVNRSISQKGKSIKIP